MDHSQEMSFSINHLAPLMKPDHRDVFHYGHIMGGATGLDELYKSSQILEKYFPREQVILELEEIMSLMSDKMMCNFQFGCTRREPEEMDKRFKYLNAKLELANVEYIRLLSEYKGLVFENTLGKKHVVSVDYDTWGKPQEAVNKPVENTRAERKRQSHKDHHREKRCGNRSQNQEDNRSLYQKAQKHN